MTTPVYSTAVTSWFIAAQQAVEAGGAVVNLAGGTVKVGNGSATAPGTVPTLSAILANGGVLNQVWSGPVNSVAPDASNAAQIDVGVVIPTTDSSGVEIGPFTVTEFAIYEPGGNLCIYGTTNLPKVTSSSGMPTSLSFYACYVESVASSVTVTPPPGSFPTLGQVGTLIASAIAALLGLSGKAPGGLIARRVFDVSQTYTPTAGTKKVRVTVVGAGGAGGGTLAMSASQFASGGGGGAGGVAISDLTSGFSGVPMTVGVAGAGVTGWTGSTGGTTSFGALLSATGGGGGAYGNPQSFSTVQAGGNGGAGTGGNIYNAVGMAGATGVAMTTSNQCSGFGGASYIGAGASAVYSATLPGIAAASPGAGGSGACGSNSGGAEFGGWGGGGLIIVEEYA